MNAGGESRVAVAGNGAIGTLLSVLLGSAGVPVVRVGGQGRPKTLSIRNQSVYRTVEVQDVDTFDDIARTRCSCFIICYKLPQLIEVIPHVLSACRSDLPILLI